MATNSKPNAPGEWIAEHDIADHLGVKRDDIRAHRPAAATGEVTAQGNIIFWLKNAAVRVAEKLGLSPAVLEKSATPTPTVSDETETLTVVSEPGPTGYHFGNPHLIRARRANGNVVVVRVVSSKKYRPKLQNGKPMELRAKPADEGAWWIRVGREPRFIGAY